MRKLIVTALLSSALVGTAAWANAQTDDSSAQGGGANSGYSSSDTSQSQTGDKGQQAGQAAQQSSQQAGQQAGQEAGKTAKQAAGQDQNQNQAQQAGEQSDQGTLQPAPGAPGETGGTTTASSAEVTKGYLSNEVIGIQPQVGAVTYSDPSTGITQGRGALGLMVDMNVMDAIDKTMGQYYLGPTVGIFYSHIGEAGANFFGQNAPSGAGGGNLFEMPFNLKVGYNITDQFRLSVHGGGNVTYRTIASAINFGASSSGTSNSSWDVFPNAGADLEFAFGQHAAFLIRPDWTITTGNSLFTGTIALVLPLG